MTMFAVPSIHSRARNATGYMTQRPKVMINRGSMRLALAIRSALVPAFLFRSTRAASGIANMRAPTHHAARKRHMSSEALFTRARMYGYWPRPRNIIAVIRWNWGSLALTRVLGASTCRVARVSVTFRSSRVPRLVSR